MITRLADNRIAMFLLGATLALGFAFSAYMVSGAMVKMRQSKLISVKGVAATQVKSDLGNWACTVRFRAATIPECYAGLEKASKEVQAYLKSAGVSDGEVTMGAAQIVAFYKKDEKGNATNTIEGYDINRWIGVESKDVAKVDTAAKGVSALMKNGVDLVVGSPSYIYTGLEAVKLDLLARAAKNAYERAEIMAGNSKGKVGGLTAASQGVFQITSVHSTETSDSGVYDTSSIDKSVRCVVTMEYDVQK